jgi:hypothetical protein
MLQYLLELYITVEGVLVPEGLENILEKLSKVQPENV